MSGSKEHERRALSGMRPTGALHLGNFHGALANWVEMQHHYDCFFFIADWHALTTGYEDTGALATHTREVLIDWLAAGLDPAACTMFIQSRVPEHAELHLLLSMITPLGWLERVPTYKDQIEQLKDRDLGTYGFLGYPVLQSADILIYRPDYVPVGEDQVAHVEITREIARRFNGIYGREADFEAHCRAAAAALDGEDGSRRYATLRRAWTEQGNAAALAEARALVMSAAGLSSLDRERLLGFLVGGGRAILPEPAVLLTRAPRVPGTDGRKMSKSYGNMIGMREDPASVAKKLRTMQTDPARVRRSDPGEPEKCPVWDLHKLYSDAATQEWVQTGCRSAGIGCLDCKKPLTEAIVAQVEGFRARAREFERDDAVLQDIIARGGDKARAAASATMAEVRSAMGLAGP